MAIQSKKGFQVFFSDAPTQSVSEKGQYQGTDLYPGIRIAIANHNTKTPITPTPSTAKTPDTPKSYPPPHDSPGPGSSYMRA
ncbi:hypothetical protein ACSYAD_32490 [Acaryochloris marina NIES-2412]|uniref:hypothetical protein n=1 Tax=Acaryochloris marina TaxID=155978 RepID=UPI0040584C8A